MVNEGLVAGKQPEAMVGAAMAPWYLNIVTTNRPPSKPGTAVCYYSLAEVRESAKRQYRIEAHHVGGWLIRSAR